MNNYWREHFDARARLSPDSPLKQVGKTVGGIELADYQLDILVRRIQHMLRLNPGDSLADLCCGNGVITARLAPFVHHILAFDFSPLLIENALKHNRSSTLCYKIEDVTTLEARQLRGYNKILIHEALQHFSSLEFVRVLKRLRESPSGTLIYIAGIPDRARIRAFYDTQEKYAYYRRSVRAKQPHVGHWWRKWLVKWIAEGMDFKTEIIEQPPRLYSAHYRFDALLERR